MKHENTIFLVVDDDGMVREIIVQYLKRFGFKNIIEAKDGKSALKIIRSSQKIDFIISDWEMPHVDGLTLLRAVRKEPELKNVLFLMVTSQGSRERMKITKAAKARVDAYIVKPFMGDVLKDKVMNLLNGIRDPSSDQFESEQLTPPPTADDIEVTVGEGGRGSSYIESVYESGEFDSDNPPLDLDVTRLNIILLLRLVHSYKKIKLYDEAIRLCTDATTHFPDNADVLYNIGHCYFLMEDYALAEDFVRQAIKINKYHAESFTLLSKMDALKKVS